MTTLRPQTHTHTHQITSTPEPTCPKLHSSLCVSFPSCRTDGTILLQTHRLPEGRMVLSRRSSAAHGCSSSARSAALSPGGCRKLGRQHPRKRVQGSAIHPFPPKAAQSKFCAEAQDCATSGTRGPLNNSSTSHASQAPTVFCKRLPLLHFCD